MRLRGMGLDKLDRRCLRHPGGRRDLGNRRVSAVEIPDRVRDDAGPDSTGGSRANFRCGQRVPTVEPSKAAALATGANMIKEDPGRRRERVQPSVVESASHIRSPGRSRTFFANPDSKSGGPCRKTNRGSMPHSTSPARTTASRRDWHTDPRSARLGGCRPHQHQLRPAVPGGCASG